MPHAIDFNDVEEKLFLIKQLRHASFNYCRYHKLSEDDSGDNLDLLEYKGRLKTILSNYMIECAIKTRMVQDFIEDDDFQDIDLTEIDRISREGLQLGQIEKGRFLINIREACNKIIHATEAGLLWSHENDGVRFWSGSIRLAGKKNEKKWVLLLEVDEWAQALENYHAILEEEVDWMAVWEYDE